MVAAILVLICFFAPISYGQKKGWGFWKTTGACVASFIGVMVLGSALGLIR